MSILAQLIEKKITFSQAASEAESWAEKLVGHDAALASIAGTALSVVKQGASNAVEAADTALGVYIGPVTLGAETLLETALAGATKGASVPFNPIISDGIDKLAAAMKAQADAWALKTKAALAAPATPAPAAG